LFGNCDAPNYDELLNEFGFDSPAQASNALITVKRHFQRVLRQVVAEYADSEEQITEEIADLFTVAQKVGLAGLDLDNVVGLTNCADTSSIGDDNDAALAAYLFALQTRPESAWRAADYPGFWLHQLAQPARPTEVFEGSQSASTEITTIGALLRDPSPSLEMLIAMKKTARGYLRGGGNGFPEEIATALYFASIAVALHRLNVRITKSADAILDHGFRLLLGQTWIDERTRHLFQDAYKLVQN
jgi:hypothetical protein